MALSDKNIVITPNIGAASDPKIVFSGADANTAAQNITLTAYPTANGTLSFDGSAGQLFSITNSLSGSIFSVNDVSGIPSIEVLDTGTIKLAQYGGNVGIGNIPSGTYKLEVTGAISGTTLTSTVATGTAPFSVTSTTPVTNLSIGGNAGTATSIAGGSIGTIPYQSATNTTAMLAVGTAGQVLQSNAAAAPYWTTLTLESLPDAWVKKSCACATTAALTINTAQVTIDGVTLTATSRVLVKDQAAPAQNGIYTGLTTTTWVRAADADTISELAGAAVNIDAGTVNGGKVFDTDLKITDTLGTTAIYFYSFLDSSALSSTTPAALGTATVGTSTTVARSDHVHTLPSLATLGAQAAGTYVTGVTGTAPVSSSGGTAPVISMAAATASVNGYMTSTYASKLDGIASSAIALSSAITGYVSGAGTVAATDSILGAIQKLNGNTPIASSTTPAALGTAAVGTGTTFARADHVHSVSGIAQLAVAQTFTAPQRGSITTSNTAAFDQSLTNNFQCTPAATVALTFSNHTAGQSGYVLLINTGGYVITAAATTKLGTSTLATISNAGTYLLSYFDNGTNAYVTTSGALA